MTIASERTVRAAFVALALAAAMFPPPLRAATVGSATGTLDIVDSSNFGFDGLLTFDNQTRYVFRQPVNLSVVGPLRTAGQPTAFDPVTGEGTFQSFSTTAQFGCFPRPGLPGCKDCACEACVCALDPSCCTPPGAWSAACVSACSNSCGQACPPPALSLDVPSGISFCGEATGVSPSVCNTIGDVAFFWGDVTVEDGLGLLPPGLVYTLNGSSSITAISPGGTRTATGQFTLNAFEPPGPIGPAPCQGIPGYCNDNDPATMDTCHPLLDCLYSRDSDLDGIFDDGDGSAVIGDAPCFPGESADCDDNCPQAANANQADYDADGIGDECDDSDGDALLDAWELVGLPGVPLPALGANPLHKDVFVEADWMEGWSCQLSRCQGGSSDGEFCSTDDDCPGGGKCVNCTCPDNGCQCLASAIVCTGTDANNGNDCSCPPGTVDECVDAASCGPGGRCVFHSHKPTASCLGGINKDQLCTSGANCPGSACMPSMARVAKVFEEAPVENPDGITGIALHVDTGQLGGGNAIPHQENTNFVGGTPRTFYQLKACNFAFGRAPAFHYMIFAHKSEECNSAGGVSESTTVNDFVVTLGSWLNEEGKPGGKVPAQAETFLHELGHNLGLTHGVPNYSPNYLSVMNYLYPSGFSGRLDYSRKVLPDTTGYLDETTLDETQGVSGFAGSAAGDGIVLWSCGQAHCPQDTTSSCQCPIAGTGCAGIGSCFDAQLNPQALCGCVGGTPDPGAIDWNCDGIIQTQPVVAEISAGDSDPFNAFALCPITKPVNYTKLYGRNDWPNLEFNFRKGGLYDPAPASCVFLTYEQYLAVPRPTLPAEICDGFDNDGDGQVDEGYDQDGDTRADCFDNCPDAANLTQADADQDGVGDACDPQSLPVPFDAVDVARLKVRFKKTAGRDLITLRGTVTLGAQSGGIYPPAERLTFTLADANGDVFSQTLRAGAVVEKPTRFFFKAPRGTPGIVTLSLKPGRPPSENRIAVVLKVKGIDARRLQQPPVTVRLVVGDDLGAETLPCTMNRLRSALLCGG